MIKHSSRNYERLRVHSVQKIRATMWSLAFLCVAQPASALNIEFDYSLDTSNFFSATNSISVLESAAAFFEQAISDDLLAINSIGPGSNSFDSVFFNPGTGALETVEDFSVAADTITIYTGGRSLGGMTAGQGGPGGFSCSGFGSFCADARTRGEGSVSDLVGPTANEVAPWGGSITFDSDGSTSWYFDDDTSTDEAFIGTDFFSVALHEIGHLLGIGIGVVDSWTNLILGSDFTGAASMAIFGSAVPLEADGGHWAEGTLSTINGIFQEAAMDPSIANGTRKRFTDLDVAALNDIGWEATTIPVPGAMPLLISALLGLFGLRRFST